jgi:hypothetical protein
VPIYWSQKCYKLQETSKIEDQVKKNSNKEREHLRPEKWATSSETKISTIAQKRQHNNALKNKWVSGLDLNWLIDL